MDLQALEYTREHYNRHAGQYADTEEALRARNAGPGAPLKKFHNNIKRQLIQRFATGAPRLLDFCCGRGGDIWKWIDAGVKFVKGIDLSDGEVEEARKRFEEARLKRREQRRDMVLECEFVATHELGTKEWKEEEQFDVATCMFAIHYFFVSEEALKQFLHNVAINLKEGGYFIGTVPDGKRINECIKSSKVYEAPMLHIQAHWQGPPKCFGSPYICAIGDTVTSGDIGSMGSFEYLVYFNVLEGVAAQHGLKLVTDYGDPSLNKLFEQGDLRKGFKHFSPSFPLDSEPSLREASALNVAFVFQKTAGTPAAPPMPHIKAGRDFQRQHSHEPVPEQQQQQSGKRPRLEEEPGSSAPPPPPTDGTAAAASAGQQQEKQQGNAAKPDYKRPTARRRTAGQTLQ